MRRPVNIPFIRPVVSVLDNRYDLLDRTLTLGVIIMGRILTVLVALITMGTAANAITLTAGPIFGAHPHNLVVCYLYNAGNTSVSVSGSIINHFTGLVTPSFNGCLAPLGAGHFCNINANRVNDAAYVCNVVVPSGTAVRGTLAIGFNDSTLNPPVFTALQTEQLR